jgi:hypothetical protein
MSFLWVLSWLVDDVVVVGVEWEAGNNNKNNNNNI